MGDNASTNSTTNDVTPNITSSSLINAPMSKSVVRSIPSTEKVNSREPAAVGPVIAAVRARGSDAGDFRDAVHEAHHAIHAKLRGPWERERIHAALVRKAKSCFGTRLGALVAYELDARGVEMLLCKRYGVPYDVEGWSAIMRLETARTIGVTLPSGTWISDHVIQRQDDPRIHRAADEVIEVVRRARLPRETRAHSRSRP